MLLAWIEEIDQITSHPKISLAQNHLIMSKWYSELHLAVDQKNLNVRHSSADVSPPLPSAYSPYLHSQYQYQYHYPVDQVSWNGSHGVQLCYHRPLRELFSSLVTKSDPAAVIGFLDFEKCADFAKHQGMVKLPNLQKDLKWLLESVSLSRFPVHAVPVDTGNACDYESPPPDSVQEPVAAVVVERLVAASLQGAVHFAVFAPLLVDAAAAVLAEELLAVV